MSMSMPMSMLLPVLPLPGLLLPQGRSQIRIFEQHHLAMIRQVSQLHGFVLLPCISESQQAVEQGCWVDIINFDLDGDGILVIDVECRTLVKIRILSMGSDKVVYADVEVIPDWPNARPCQVSRQLADSLLQYFDNNYILRELYQGEFCQQPTWVVSRWLELLPVSLAAKLNLAEPNCYPQAKAFVEDVILKKN